MLLQFQTALQMSQTQFTIECTALQMSMSDSVYYRVYGIKDEYVRLSLP